jgi:hypothetical protein
MSRETGGESLRLAELLETNWQRLAELVEETIRERGLVLPPALRDAVVATNKRPPVCVKALAATLRGEAAPDLIREIADRSASEDGGADKARQLCDVFQRAAIRLLVERSRDEPAMREPLEQAVRDLAGQLDAMRTCALAEEAARARGLLERLYDAVGEAILIVDGATGGVLRANPAAEKLFGLSAEQIRWMFLKDLLPQVGAEMWAALQQVTDERQLAHFETVVPAQEAESKHVRVVAGKLRQPGGEIIHLSLDDVTEQVRLDRELESLADELRAQVGDQIKELEAQRRFFEALLDAVPLRVVVLDRHLRVIHANPAYYLPRGSTKAEVVGRRLEEVFPRQILAAAGLEQAIRSSMETKRPVRWSGYRMATPEHQERLVDIRLDPCVGVGDEMCVLMTIEDVTARHRQLYERTILQQILRAMLEARDLERLLHAILTGMTAGGSAGLGFNRAFLLLVDEDGTTLRGKLAVGPESKEEAYQIWSEVGQEYQTIEDFMKDYDRSPPDRRPLVDTVARMVFAMSDTEHLPVAAAARGETVHVTRASADPRVSPLLWELLGVEEFVVAPMMVKGKRVGVAMADNFVTTQPIGEDDIALLTALASHAALAIDTASAHELERQQARELEEAYDKLAGTQQQLVRSKQLAAIGEMAAIVAHEIRNPLSTIGGFARLLQRHPTDAERVKRNARIIKEEVERLERILEDLLELSRPEELKLEECDIGALVYDVADMARSDPKAAQMEVYVEVEGDLPRVAMDPALVREVLSNLIRNGLEAMHPGGTLTLRARHTGAAVTIDVSDTGEGIPAERLDTIFEAFVTTKPTGTGLGLARSRKIIEQHGAALTVESEPGAGSTFSLVFPTEVKAQAAAQAEQTEAGHGA